MNSLQLHRNDKNNYYNYYNYYYLLRSHCCTADPLSRRNYNE